jgi:hypothetical protein
MSDLKEAFAANLLFMDGFKGKVAEYGEDMKKCKECDEKKKDCKCKKGKGESGEDEGE